MNRLWLLILRSRVPALTATPIELHHEGGQAVSRLFQHVKSCSLRRGVLQPRCPSSPSGFTEDSNPSVFRAGEPA